MQPAFQRRFPQSNTWCLRFVWPKIWSISNIPLSTKTDHSKHSFRKELHEKTNLLASVLLIQNSYLQDPDQKIYPYFSTNQFAAICPLHSFTHSYKCTLSPNRKEDIIYWYLKAIFMDLPVSLVDCVWGHAGRLFSRFKMKKIPTLSLAIPHSQSCRQKSFVGLVLYRVEAPGIPH